MPLNVPAIREDKTIWYLSSDVGGTFTDLVLIDSETKRTFIDKVPSSQRGSATHIAEGIKRIATKAGIGPADIDLFVHGFTVATNAFLMRRGARCALVVTEGFRDVLEIGSQMRPNLYALRQSKPLPVVPRSHSIEVCERMDSFGSTVTELSEGEIKRVCTAVAALKPEAVAVSLNFSFVNETHERRLVDALAASLGTIPVFASIDVNPQVEEYPRANTTAIAAYVGPVVHGYISELEDGLHKDGITCPLRLMRSDGGVATPRAARQNPAQTMLSGPAGGVIAGVKLAAAVDIPNAITFDMGGTSADFSAIVDGEPRLVRERDIDGQPLRLPTLDIETISAGGGSIAWVDRGGALKVGPESAGAIPGPACYGNGGEAATTTDATVVLGILDPENYLGGEMSLDPELARNAISKTVAKPLGLSIEEAALGIIAVANASMTQAIRTLSVERGFDVRDFGLIAFGGAGPVYAPFLMDSLGMSQVIIPRHPGVFAAQGLLMSDIRHTTQRAFFRAVTETPASEATIMFSELRSYLDEQLATDGIEAGKRRFRCFADLRYEGQFHELLCPIDDPETSGWWDHDAVRTRFVELHHKTYGHSDPDSPIEIVNLRMEGFGEIDKVGHDSNLVETEQSRPTAGTRKVFLDSQQGFQDIPVHVRQDLSEGEKIVGPALVTQTDSTVLLLSGHTGTVVENGVMIITRKGGEK